MANNFQQRQQLDELLSHLPDPKVETAHFKSLRKELKQQGQGAIVPEETPRTAHGWGFRLAWVLALVLLVFGGTGFGYVYLLPPPTVLGDTLALAEVQKISPGTPIKITFSRQMNRASVEQAFHITPNVPGVFSWSKNTLIFTPESGSFDPNGEYTVSIDSTARDMLYKSLEHDFYQQFQIAGPPQVLFTYPLGEVSADEHITVMFDRPMTVLTTLEATIASPIELTISPELDGAYKWLGTSAVQFIPEKLAFATTYTVTVPKETASLYGETLAEAVTFRFDTLHPAVTAVAPEPGSKRAGPASVIMVQFNQPMNANSVEEKIHLVQTIVDTPDAVPVEFTSSWSEDKRRLTLTPKTLALDSFYHLTIAKGAQGIEGSIGMDQDFVMDFGTVGTPILTASEPADGNQSAGYFGMSLEFSNPMKDISDEETEKMFTLDPPIEELIYFWDEDFPMYDQFGEVTEILEGGHHLSIQGQFKPSTKYVLTISKELEDIYGQAFQGPFSIRFTTQAYPADLAFAERTTYATWDGYLAPVMYHLQSMNTDTVELTISKVSPTDFRTYEGDYYSGNEWYEYRGKGKAGSTTWTVETEGALNTLAEIPIDLGTLKPGLYFLEATSKELQALYQDPNFRIFQVFSVSKTGLALKYTPDGVLIWATDLQSGEGVGNVTVTIETKDGEQVAGGVTDSRGLMSAKWLKPELFKDKELYETPKLFVIGARGPEMIYMTSSFTEGIDSWQFGIASSFREEEFRGYLYTDRPLYRPGQDVFFKALLRGQDDTTYSVPQVGTEFDLRVFDGRGQTIWQEIVESDASGTISGSLHLDTSAALGYYGMEVRLAADVPPPDPKALPNLFLKSPITSDYFQVEEYRKPEFLVEVTAPKENVSSGEKVEARVHASYFFGGDVSGADVSWTVSTSNYFFSKWSDPMYSFGTSEYYSCWYNCPDFGGTEVVSEGKGTLDDQGQLRIAVPTDLKDQENSQLLTVEATVTDVNQAQVANRTFAVVHKGDFYVGLKSRSYVSSVGDEMTVDLQTVDQDGHAVGNIETTVTFFHRIWNTIQKKNVDGGFYYDSTPEDTEVSSVQVKTDAEGKGNAAFVPEKGGEYRVLAESRDARGNLIQSDLFTYVSEDTYISWERRNDNRIDIVLDKREYEIGDTAKLLVKSPVAGTKGLLTIERKGILDQKMVDLPTTSTVLEIPVTEEYLPNVFVSLLLVKGHGENQEAGFYMGYTPLRMNPEPKELTIDVQSSKDSYLPGEEVSLTLTTRDHAGKPVSADLSIGVVDESLLSLLGEQVEDLMSRFWGERFLSVQTASTLTTLISREFVPSSRTGGKGGGGGQESERRGTFKDTAYWNPNVTTDDQGQATLTFNLPDNTTTWQILAIGATETTLVGQTEIDVVAQKPVLLRPVTPRFAVNGDTMTVSAIVNNLTDANQRSTISLSGEGFTITSKGTLKGTVDRNNDQLFEWEISVHDGVSELIFLYHLDAEDGLTDEVEWRIPVEVPRTPEVMATSGALADKVLEVIDLPENVDRSQGALTLTFHATLISMLTQPLEYLKDFQYLCSEQTVSRILPALLMKQLLATAPDLPREDFLDEKELDQMVPGALQRLYSYQRPDGGWGFWQESLQSDPFLTSYVLLGLHQASLAGYAVDPNSMQSAKSFLDGVIHSTDLQGSDAMSMAGMMYGNYRDVELADVRSFILFTLSEMGSGDPGLIQNLYDAKEKLSLFGRAYLMLALDNVARALDYEPTVQSLLREKRDTLRDELVLSVKETALGVHWEETVNSPLLMGSNVRTTAVILQGLVRVAPDHPLIPKVMEWLLKVRREGHWESTQETSAVLQAFVEYVKVTDELDSDFDFTVFQNRDTLHEGEFSHDNLFEADEVSIPVSELKEEAGTTKIGFLKDGAGKLYYDMNLRYFVRSEGVPAVSQGVGIYKEYFELDDDKLEHPLTSAKVGENLLVKLTVIVPEDLYYVAVDDALISGTEAVNLQFQTTTQTLSSELYPVQPTLEDGMMDPYYFYGSPFIHTEMRDDRVLLFADYLPAGVYEYQYIVRTTIPGTFQSIPSQVFQMYMPDVFGRTAGGRFEIKK